MSDPHDAFKQRFDRFRVLASEADIDGAAMEPRVRVCSGLIRIVPAHQRQQQTQLGDVIALLNEIENQKVAKQQEIRAGNQKRDS